MTMLRDAPAPPSIDDGDELSDHELTELALAADPDAPIDADAVAWTPASTGAPGLLPDWYMPAGVTRQREPWQVAVVVVIITAFLLINAFGLCITYGHLVPA